MASPPPAHVRSGRSAATPHAASAWPPIMRDDIDGDTKTLELTHDPRDIRLFRRVKAGGSRRGEPWKRQRNDVLPRKVWRSAHATRGRCRELRGRIQLAYVLPVRPTIGGSAAGAHRGLAM